MNKEQLVSAVARAAALHPRQVLAVLHGLEAIVIDELEATGAVRIPGLVWLRCVERGERIARNPNSGEEFVAGRAVFVRARPVTRLAAHFRTGHHAHASQPSAQALDETQPVA
jgi:nucleoid DNA-binding protein